MKQKKGTDPRCQEKEIKGLDPCIRNQEIKLKHKEKAWLIPSSKEPENRMAQTLMSETRKQKGTRTCKKKRKQKGIVQTLLSVNRK